MSHITSILEQYRVSYVSEGKNVAKGHVNIRCPFCGPADPSAHLGINEQTGAWGCWRDPSHRGYKLARLWSVLFHIPRVEAELLCQPFVDRKYFSTVLQSLERPAVSHPTSVLKWPSELHRLCVPYLTTHEPAWNYFLRRRVSPDAVLERQTWFGIHGRWGWRVVFPIRSPTGQVVSWIGRAIGERQPRYLTPSASEGKNVKACVFGEELLQEGGDVLVVTEGPFDAIRLDWVGRRLGVRATCIFGSSVSPAQKPVLRRLSRRFSHVVVMLDPGNDVGAFISSWGLASVSAQPICLSGESDLGSMSNEQLIVWSQLCKEVGQWGGRKDSGWLYKKASQRLAVSR